MACHVGVVADHVTTGAAAVTNGIRIHAAGREAVLLGCRVIRHRRTATDSTGPAPPAAAFRPLATPPRALVTGTMRPTVQCGNIDRRQTRR
jgi:hypothetical protein